VSETRKLAAILVSDIVGYSRLAGADEDRILARLRTLRSDLIDPTIAVHHGRIIKRTGDGSVIEFRSVVDAVNCAIEVQRAMVERNAEVAQDKRIEFRIGIHLGDVVEESDGDLMGDGVNIAARLQGVAAPGAICLSEDAYRQVKGRLDLKATDLGPTQLKNIAEPIRIYSIEVGKPAQAKPAPAAPTPERSDPPRLSIVVLPFANLGGDPEQDYFVDGVTESLTTDLSRIGGSFVIGRHTAFTYKGKAADLRQIGRELNVRYVLEGSVQRRGDRMRVNAQLIAAETGSHLWAERFDKPVADLFEAQDEIVARLARQLDATLIAAEARRAERTPHPNSTDLLFQGLAWFHKGQTLRNVEQALGYFERALAIDPENVDALAWKALAYAVAYASGFALDMRPPLVAAEEAATRALLLAPDHAGAHLVMSHVYGFTKRLERAIAESERCLALDRNFAPAHATIGMHKLHLDRAEATEAHVRDALRLSPRDAWAYVWLAIAGFASDFLQRYDEAVAWQQRSIQANGNYAIAHFHLASALANLGRLEEARAAAQAGLAIDPKFTIGWFLTVKFSDTPAHLAWRERLADGMRKAGLPVE
jgi:TolB-like protein/class 3 adenylate cyclase